MHVLAGTLRKTRLLKQDILKKGKFQNEQADYGKL